MFLTRSRLSWIVRGISIMKPKWPFQSWTDLNTDLNTVSLANVSLSWKVSRNWSQLLNQFVWIIHQWQQEPAQVTDSKTICCWCCASGPISARVWIDRTGYVPGQLVPFCAQVENRSGRQMLGSKVQLVQNTTFHAQGKSKAVVHVLSELERGAFGESDVWDHFPIAVPPVPPSSLPKCNIIEIDYSIVVIKDISHFNCRGTGLEIIWKINLKNLKF